LLLLLLFGVIPTGVTNTSVVFHCSDVLCGLPAVLTRKPSSALCTWRTPTGTWLSV